MGLGSTTVFLLVVVVCNGLHPLQRESSMMRSEDYAFLKKRKEKNIRSIAIDYAGLVKVFEVSLPRSMTPLALGNFCIDFQ